MEEKQEEAERGFKHLNKKLISDVEAGEEQN